jgi:hypothetical protein
MIRKENNFYKHLIFNKLKLDLLLSLVMNSINWLTEQIPSWVRFAPNIVAFHVK